MQLAQFEQDINTMQETKHKQTIGDRINEFLSQNYLFTDERIYKLTKPKNTKIGEIFEIIFKILIENEGLKEGKDFLDLRNLKHRCIGIPDFYFINSKTFVEVKSNCSNNTINFNENQLNKIKKLKKQGFSIITLFFDVKIMEENLTLYSLLKRLIG